MCRYQNEGLLKLNFGYKVEPQLTMLGSSKQANDADFPNQ